MNFYLDTEFHEGFHKPLFGRRRHFIDLISIGICTSKTDKYYAVSRDFDIKAAWNSFQIDRVPVYGDQKNIYLDGYMDRKVYWLRYNVLRPIFFQLWGDNRNLQHLHGVSQKFTYSNFKKIILLYGKSLERIKNEVVDFIDFGKPENMYEAVSRSSDVNFYGYYSDYDWVAFCSMFGKMIDLPENFPKYMRDLKQTLDDVAYHTMNKNPQYYFTSFQNAVEYIQADRNYPKQDVEHTADDDAWWNLRLHNFLKTYLLNPVK